LRLQIAFSSSSWDGSFTRVSAVRNTSSSLSSSMFSFSNWVLKYLTQCSNILSSPSISFPLLSLQAFRWG
jgi:hypothetical protein